MPLALPELTEEQKNGLTREAYLAPESPRVMGILEESINSGGYFEFVKKKHDWSIKWLDKGREKLDFAALDQIYDLLWATKKTEDDEFANQIIPRIEVITKESPLLQLLDRTFSKTSKHLSVLQHILDVLRKLKTKGMSANARFLMRVEVVTHDLGKSIAFDPTKDTHEIDEDYFQTHAFLSARIWRVYAESRGLGESLILRVEQVLAYHHGLELIDKEILSLEEFGSLLPEEIILYLCALAVSDVYSAHPGSIFVINNLEISWNLMHSPVKSDARADEPKSIGLIAQFFPLIIESTLFRIGQYEVSAVDKAVKLKAKLISFIEFLYSLPIIEAVKEFLLSITPKLPHAILEYVQLGEGNALAATPA